MEQNNMGIAGRLAALIVAIIIMLAFYYGLNHLVMGVQGLPLNLDLTPAG
ncbi:hypothetical protein [Thiolapillus sp.]